ncbi:MAG: SpoIIE family protein phosphatase [Chloroflexi bacterium]|nr:SpoIIE family protein phosphatase [Chloroflexota bacterium]
MLLGMASFVCPGETRLGDRWVVRDLPDGLLMAVIDGLGHGRLAYEAAEQAAMVMESRPQDPLERLFAEVHRAQTGFRGVVMSAARIDTRRSLMTWLGVGNVGGVILRHSPDSSAPRRHWLALHPGLLGTSLPALRSEAYPLSGGDVLVMTTDGIRMGYADGMRQGRTPQELADYIIASHRTGNDDAMVLAARYPGPAS